MKTISFNTIIDTVSNFLNDYNLELTFNTFSCFKCYIYSKDFIEVLKRKHKVVIDTKYLDEILESYYNIYYTQTFVSDVMSPFNEMLKKKNIIGRKQLLRAILSLYLPSTKAPLNVFICRYKGIIKDKIESYLLEVKSSYVINEEWYKLIDEEMKRYYKQNTKDTQ